MNVLWDPATLPCSFWERSAETILVTGALSHLGFMVVERLCNAGWSVRVLLRAEDQCLRQFPERAIVYTGSIFDVESLHLALRHCQRVLHLEELSWGYAQDALKRVNIEGTRNLVQACKTQGVKQFIYLSSQQVNYRKSTLYGRSKKIAEDVIRGSKIQWTILRPSMIIGPHGSQEYRWLSWWTRHMRVFPLPLGGHVLKRPVHEEDVALGLLKVFEAQPKTIAFKNYALAGRESMTLLGLIDLITGEAQLPERKILALSPTLVSVLLKIYKRLSPVKGMALVEAWCDASQDINPDTAAAQEDFGFNPQPLQGRLNYAQAEDVTAVVDLKVMGIKPVKSHAHKPSILRKR